MCTSPRLVKIPRTKTYMKAPCGKCCECLKKYQNDWKVRLTEESKDWQHTFFWTLTYNEDTVHYKQTIDETSGEINELRTLYKKDVQDWLKRFRTAYQRKYKQKAEFKYFICGEYCPTGTRRPHYHVLFFTNIDHRILLSMLLYDWRTRYGFVDCLNDSVKKAGAAAGYVAKYCSKGVFSTTYEKEFKVDPTFRVFSKGLGAGYIDRMKDWHLARHMDQWKGDKKYVSRSALKFRCVLEPSRPNVKDGVIMHHNPNMYSYHYKKDYLNWIVDHMYYFDANGFKHSLPQYYKDRIYKNKFTTKVTRYDYKTQKYKEVTVTKWISRTLLSNEIENVVLERADKVYDTTLEQLQAEHPDWSFRKVAMFACDTETTTLADREVAARTSLAKFYQDAVLRNKSLNS